MSWFVWLELAALSWLYTSLACLLAFVVICRKVKYKIQNTYKDFGPHKQPPILPLNLPDEVWEIEFTAVRTMQKDQISVVNSVGIAGVKVSGMEVLPGFSL